MPDWLVCESLSALVPATAGRWVGDAWAWLSGTAACSSGFATRFFTADLGLSLTGVDLNFFVVLALGLGRAGLVSKGLTLAIAPVGASRAMPIIGNGLGLVSRIGSGDGRLAYRTINRQCRAQTNTVTRATATARRQRIGHTRFKGNRINFRCRGSTKNKVTILIQDRLIYAIPEYYSNA